MSVDNVATRDTRLDIVGRQNNVKMTIDLSAVIVVIFLQFYQVTKDDMRLTEKKNIRSNCMNQSSKDTLSLGSIR